MARLPDAISDLIARARAVLWNAHPRLQLKKQQFRSKDGNGNSHVDIATWEVLFLEPFHILSKLDVSASHLDI